MKDKREYVFNHMEPSEGGGLELTVDGILQAMEEYANEKLTAFMINYIGRGASKFEVQRLLKQFNEDNPF